MPQHAPNKQDNVPSTLIIIIIMTRLWTPSRAVVHDGLIPDSMRSVCF